jgi:hypothetical protein
MGSRGKVSEAVHTNYSCTLLSLCLYFVEIVTMLVMETNRYCHPYLDNIDERINVHILSRGIFVKLTHHTYDYKG